MRITTETAVLDATEGSGNLTPLNVTRERLTALNTKYFQKVRMHASERVVTSAAGLIG